MHFYHTPVTSPQSFIHLSDSHVAQIVCVGNPTSSSVRPKKTQLLEWQIKSHWCLKPNWYQEKRGGKMQQQQPSAELGGPSPGPAAALEPLFCLFCRGAAGSAEPPLTSPARFNVTVTLHSTLHPISFEADKDCFCFISIGLLMAYSLLSRCIFIR